MSLVVVILAAGQGTRMRSALPKVLQPLAGRPLLAHVLDTAAALQPRATVVVHGHGGERVREAFAGQEIAGQEIAGHDILWVEQTPQLGTGHALQQAVPELRDDDRVLVLYGDVPLPRTETLQPLLSALDTHALALLSVELSDPTGYGRILRDGAAAVTGIVEEKDADTAQRAIREANTGILAARAGPLRDWLSRLGNDNSQGEYYLTDCVALAVGDGASVCALPAPDALEVAGVNDKAQLAALERAYQLRAADALMRAGLTLADPARFDLRGRLAHGQDVSLDVNVVLEGEVELGEGVRIGPGCVLKDCRIGAHTEVLAHSVIESARIGARCRIGPFARIRPDTDLADAVHVGNFVEVKKSAVAEGSKINHLSYVGDSRIGARVNVGAGTITCNYDGANKHLTVIEDDAFIGSDSQLVAPVTVGAGATIAAGSTITRDAPPGELTLSRTRQHSVRGWRRPQKKS
jgi:bifunctional UDP-N-acetylglucosamine pyrophosphorylase/glucosamine-1-phosphate N-acetyltransferase